MKTLSQILDDGLYSRDDRDPRAFFYITQSGSEFEVSEELRDELNADYGHCTPDYLFSETGLTLDEYIEQKAVPTS